MSNAPKTRQRFNRGGGGNAEKVNLAVELLEKVAATTKHQNRDVISPVAYRARVLLDQPKIDFEGGYSANSEVIVEFPEGAAEKSRGVGNRTVVEGFVKGDRIIANYATRISEPHTHNKRGLMAGLVSFAPRFKEEDKNGQKVRVIAGARQSVLSPEAETQVQSFEQLKGIFEDIMNTTEHGTPGVMLHVRDIYALDDNGNLSPEDEETIKTSDARSYRQFAMYDERVDGGAEPTYVQKSVDDYVEDFLGYNNTKELLEYAFANPDMCDVRIMPCTHFHVSKKSITPDQNSQRGHASETSQSLIKKRASDFVVRSRNKTEDGEKYVSEGFGFAPGVVAFLTETKDGDVLTGGSCASYLSKSSFPYDGAVRASNVLSLACLEEPDLMPHKSVIDEALKETRELTREHFQKVREDNLARRNGGQEPAPGGAPAP